MVGAIHATVPPSFFRALRALSGALASGGAADYLSGLLLGAENRRGAALVQRHAAGEEAMTLVGGSTRCERYRDAFALAGMKATAAPARRLRRIARDPGMLAA